MRETTITSLRKHPGINWHPTKDNPNFLGFFRWKIFRLEEKKMKKNKIVFWWVTVFYSFLVGEALARGGNLC